MAKPAQRDTELDALLRARAALDAADVPTDRRMMWPPEPTPEMLNLIERLWGKSDG